MTEQVTRRMLMKPGSNCLHRKAEHMMLSHQQGWPYYSTQTELLIKLVTVEAKHLHQAQIYLHQAIRAGFSKRGNGSLSGRRFRCDQVMQRATSLWVHKLGCRGGCSRTRVALKCTALYSCNDKCNNRDYRVSQGAMLNIGQ